MSRRRKEEWPEQVNVAMRTAMSASATVFGVHRACPRRGCRRAGRCHAAAEGMVCPRPMPALAEEVAVEMVVFLWRLGNGRP